MLPLFFVEKISYPELVGDNAHHVERVLRMAIGEELLISDGEGNWAKCSITAISKKLIELKLIESGFEEPSRFEISVLQALPKSDRAKETVELLTEAGVQNIYPWQSARSIGKESEKWAVAAIEASKQSRRFYIPNVHEKVGIDKALIFAKDFDQILICHESAERQISDVVKVSKKTLVVIGPEGGITDEELIQFQSVGGEVIKLGRPVLRSAHAGTAAVAAISALMKVW